MNKNKKKKIIQPVPKARLHIQASFNNIIITMSDQGGNTLGWTTAGSSGFKGAKKSTPFAAQQAMNDLLNKLEPYGIKSVNIFVSGVGSGRDAAFRALISNRIEIDSIRDVTPLPHNGVRTKKPRRV